MENGGVDPGRQIAQRRRPQHNSRPSQMRPPSCGATEIMVSWPYAAHLLQCRSIARLTDVPYGGAITDDRSFGVAKRGLRNAVTLKVDWVVDLSGRGGRSIGGAELQDIR